MKKHYLVVLLSFVLAANCIGCGKEDAGSKTTAVTLDIQTDEKPDTKEESTTEVTEKESTVEMQVTTEEESTIEVPVTTVEESTTEVTVTTVEESTTEVSVTIKEESTTIAPETTPEETSSYAMMYDLAASYIAEYAHVDTDLLKLGNEEHGTVTISASPAGLTLNDFGIISDDEEILNYNSIDVYDAGNKTYIEIDFTGNPKKETETTYLYIFSLYDYEQSGDIENVDVLSLPIQIMNSRDGKIVYVTSTGEKYHYSESCAGGTATTVLDAEICEYEPCGKCVR